jgi:hypothetical protein
MDGESNLAVIEVKTSECSKKKAIEDIAELVAFTQEAHYQHGIFLIFGSSPAKSILNSLTKDPSETAYKELIVLHHKNPGKEPERYYWKEAIGPA